MNANEEDVPVEVRAALADPSLRFDRYVLVKELGRGAMGAVFRAFDLTIRRWVAIKVLLQTQDLGEDEMRRFRREASAAGKLQHPGIVQVHDLGKHQGRPFIVMELVDGEGFDAILERGPVDRARGLAVVREVALALAHAHAHGVTHRDVKPPNILIDRDGRARLGDFGVARDLLSSSGATRTGELIGTPLYMSPEQAVGDTKWHGPHTDVYALGALIHRVVAGREPFSDSASLAVLIGRVRREPPPSLGSGSPELDALAERCLAKDPAARPTAEDVARALEPRAAPAPVAPPEVARGPSPLAVIVLVVVIALSAAGAITFVAWPKESPSSATPPRPDAQPAAAPRAPARPTIPDICRTSRESEKRSARLLSVWGSYDWKKTGITGGIAFTPDGRKLITSGWETLVVWDAETGRELEVRRSDSRRSRALAVTSDGKLALEALDDGSVVEYALGKRGDPVVLGKHEKEASGVAVSGDGRRAVSAGTDGTVTVWSISEGASAPVRSFETAPSWWLPIAVSSDRRWCVTGHADGMIRQWDLESGRLLRSFDGHNRRTIAAILISADGRRLLSAAEDGTLRLWDVATGAQVFASPPYAGRTLSIALAPDGRSALAGPWLDAGDQAVRLWDLESCAEVGNLEGPEWFASAVCFSPDGARAASAGQDSAIRVWDVATRRDVRPPVAGHGDAVTAVAFSPDGKLALSGSVDRTLKLWDVTTGRELRSFAGHGALVTSISWFADGRRAVSSSGDGTLRVWDVETGRASIVLRVANDGCARACFLDGQRRVASADRDGVVRVWDLERRDHTDVPAMQGKLRTIAVSADQRSLISIGEDQSVVHWGWQAERGLAQFGRLDVSDSRDAARAAFAGRRVVTTHLDGSIQFHDLDGGAHARAARHGAGEGWLTIEVTVSPDGRRAVTAGATDHAIVVWDVETATAIDAIDLSSSTDHVCSLAFAPDGKSFLAGTARGVVLRFGFERP